jgi:hypothetical protein
MLKAGGEWEMTLVDGLRIENATSRPEVAHSRKAGIPVVGFFRAETGRHSGSPFGRLGPGAELADGPPVLG